MKNRIIISIVLIITSVVQLFGNDFRTVKGKIVVNQNEGFYGARIEVYGNTKNAVYSNENGEFEIVVPKTEKVILTIVSTVHCSFNFFLYEVELENKYVKIEIFTAEANKRTQKIRQQQISKKRKNDTFYIELKNNANTERLAIRKQVIKFSLLFPNWNNLKLTVYQESEKEANSVINLVKEELLIINSNLIFEKEIKINTDDNFDKGLVKVKFKKEASR